MTKFSFPDTSDSENRMTYGDSFYIRQGTVIRRRRSKPPSYSRKHPSKKRWSKTSLRSEVNALARQIGDRWSTLSQSQKSDWSAYAVYFSQFKTGFEAFFANNMRLLRSGHESFGWVDNITSPPLTVEAPTGLCVIFVSELRYFCVTWSTPNCVSLFVQCFEWIPPGLRRSRDFRWKYENTGYSLDASLLVDVSQLDAGREAVLGIRTANLRGEISDFIIPGAYPRPGVIRGVYGYSAYGYAYYDGEA